MPLLFKADSRERIYPESNTLLWTSIITLGLAGLCYLLAELTESPLIFLIVIPSFLLMKFFDFRRTLWLFGKEVGWSSFEIKQDRIELNDYKLVFNGIKNIQIRISQFDFKQKESNTLDIVLDDSTELAYYIVILSQEHLESLEKAIKYLKEKGLRIDYLDTSKLIWDN